MSINETADIRGKHMQSEVGQFHDFDVEVKIWHSLRTTCLSQLSIQWIGRFLSLHDCVANILL